MAKWTKETVTQGDKEITRYKEGSEYVPTNKVPAGVVTALEGQKDGFAVDELGDEIDPETQTDESADEQAPEQNEENDDDESTVDDEEESTPAKPAPRARARRASSNNSENFDEDGNELGMGFKRVDGKTVDIFDGKTPHTAVRSVSGIMVPLSAVNAFGDLKTETPAKTDAEIIERLKKLGKL